VKKKTEILSGYRSTCTLLRDGNEAGVKAVSLLVARSSLSKSLPRLLQPDLPPPLFHAAMQRHRNNVQNIFIHSPKVGCKLEHPEQPPPRAERQH